MIIRKALPQDIRPAKEVSAVSFEYGLDPLPEASTPPEPEREGVNRYVALTDDGSEVVATMEVIRYLSQFDGNACLMGGIGGVATLPQYRRNGSIRDCFALALREMYENGYVLSYLYPFSSGFYRQFGYESFMERLDVTLKLDTLRPQETDGTLVLVRPGNPMTEAIRTLDRIRESRYNLMVQHDDEYYSWTEKEDPAVRKVYTYVYLAKDGTPKAYTTFRGEQTPNGRIHRCSRFVFHDREGFHGLMGLFKRCAADHTAVQFTLPNIPGMLYLPRELALGSVEITHRMQGSVRVVNVREALKLAKYRGCGRAVLQIQDSMLSENNGTFAVEFENGRAVSVAETKEAPDAVLEISTFSALLLGAAEFADASMLFDGLQVNNPGVLDRVFYRKDTFLVDFF